MIPSFRVFKQQTYDIAKLNRKKNLSINIWFMKLFFDSLELKPSK